MLSHLWKRGEKVFRQLSPTSSGKLSGRPCKKCFKKRRNIQPWVEQLEDRTLPSTIVEPGAMNGWSLLRQGDAAAAFVAGEAVSGLGSLYLQSNTNKVYFGTTAGSGGAVSAFGGITYNTKITSSQVAHLAPYINIFTATNVYVYEPIYQGLSPVPNTWETWDAQAGAKWWAVYNPWELKTLGDWAVENGDETILGVAIIVGQASGGSWSNFNAYIDDVIIGGNTYDLEPAPGVTVSASIPLAYSQGAVPGQFTVTRDAVTPNPITVTYDVGGTAIAGTHYVGLSGTVTIPANQASATIDVTPIADAVTSPNRNVVVTLDPAPFVPPAETYPGPGYTLPGPSSATVTIIGNATPPPVPVLPGGTCPSTDPITTSRATMGNPENPISSGPVRYFDGTVQLSFADLGSEGFGTPWGQTRSWTNGPGYARNGVNGTGWVDSQMPSLLQVNATTLAVISDGTTARYFDDAGGGNYQGRFYDPTRLRYDAGSDEYVLNDDAGIEIRFNSFSPSLPERQRGLFKSFRDAGGNLTQVMAYNADGTMAEVQRSRIVGGDTITEAYLYAYVSSGPLAGTLETVTLRRRVNTDPWETVRKTAYAYYGDGEANGNLGDLKTVTLLDENDNVIDTSYYRYRRRYSSDRNRLRHRRPSLSLHQLRCSNRGQRRQPNPAPVQRPWPADHRISRARRPGQPGDVAQGELHLH